MDKDDMIAAAREAAARLGTQKLGEDEFLASAGVGRHAIHRHFGSWRVLCEKAGLMPRSTRPFISDDKIFRALHDTFIARGGVGTMMAIRSAMPLDIHTLYRRSGTWGQALTDFAAWAGVNAPDFPYAEEIEERIAYLTRTKRSLPKHMPRPRSDIKFGPLWPSMGVRAAGEPLNGRPLLHEPVNEFGVVLAFGMMAKELGYVVDSVAGAFPDCIAKRRVGDKRWEAVRIEFEFRSRNFVGHGHDPKGCDVIVCWEHDWPDCPLEVLELKPAMVGR